MATKKKQAKKKQTVLLLHNGERVPVAEERGGWYFCGDRSFIVGSKLVKEVLTEDAEPEKTEE